MSLFAAKRLVYFVVRNKLDMMCIHQKSSLMRKELIYKMNALIYLFPTLLMYSNGNSKITYC